MSICSIRKPISNTCKREAPSRKKDDAFLSVISKSEELRVESEDIPFFISRYLILIFDPNFI